ncbi:hypothetical protein [Psychrobacillus sp. MER TA 171]|uniref:hypothetical protein n=1 Tax=Psychrobacillus sp. MER TA 171 TaxID=2939577 RepID=UPI00204188E7|nr:hypothetical protein [Psychrobacillus sp. MER TA 171]MCM3358672.1 hypothetical protein [Psychrobacillus sp. MER TA 171]
MNNFEVKIKQNLEILHMKKEELYNAKKAIGRDTVWSDIERYKLNMEMLTWIVNTDSLLMRLSKKHSKEKNNLKDSEDIKNHKEQGTLLGLYYAFNCFKHNFSILSTETIRESSLFTDHEGTEYVIANNEFSETTKKFSQKYKEYDFYKEYLVGQNVELTFNDAISFLNKQYQELYTS